MTEHLLQRDEVRTALNGEVVFWCCSCGEPKGLPASYREAARWHVWHLDIRGVL